MTENKYRILFVCMGNICRSPTAEGLLINKVNAILKSAKTLLKKNKKNVCKNILNNFSITELRNSLNLVQKLSKSMEVDIRKSKGFVKSVKPKSFNQIW